MRVFDVLSKAVEVDDAAGAALIDCVVYDFMADLVELNKSDITALLGLWGLDRVQVAKRALFRSYVDSVSKGEYPADDVHQAAEWLAGIERFVTAAARGDVSKAGDREWWMIGNKRVQREVSRDAQGRFTRGVNQNLSRTVSPLDSENMAPPLRRFADSGNWIGGMTSNAAASFQGQYEEALNFAQEFKRDLGSAASDADVVFMLQGPDGRIRNVRADLSKIDKKKYEIPGLRADDKILGVEVAPKFNADSKAAARIAEFNVLGGAGGSALAQLANTNPELRAQLAQSLKMRDVGANESGLSRLFGILSSGGAVLSGVTGSGKIGQVAALVGVLGPQAEQVLGPYVKRSAYRYRGTETTPDSGFRDPQAALNSRQVDQVAADFPMSSGRSLEMHARADAASAILAETIPQDPIIARLSEASGQVLPSQGVIYDQDGRLVSQSVGFTDDHYLPFDLANLGRLRGGQYVRTRQQGGLTGEDIYTAVMSGARQIQVVSGSGVFTLEMAPDFRGARAMSDKARGMYDRYLKILDAVDASNLYLEDISAKDKQRAWADARVSLGEGASDADVKSLAEANIERMRRSAASIDDQDEEWASENALREAGGVVRQGETAAQAATRLRGRERRIYEDAYEENLEERRASKTNRLRLNGQGYAVALKTLQEQFPYFIADTRYRELNKLPTDRVQNLPKTRVYSQDSGYAAPGSLRARNVKQGFYRPGDLEPGWKSERPRPSKPDQDVDGEGSGDKSKTSVVEGSEGKGSATSKTRAANVGANKVMDSAKTVLDKQIKASAGDISQSLETMPVSALASFKNRTLPFETMTNKSDRAKWLLSQSSGGNVLKELTGSNSALAAEALADEKTVYEALASLLDDEGADDWFDSGGSIAGKKSLKDASEWIADKASAIAEAALMKQGLVQAPSSAADQVKHRGLMPMQLPGIALISSRDDFQKFVAESGNEEVYALSRALAFNGSDQRTLPKVAEVANKQLDAIKAVGEAREEMMKQVRANPGAAVPSPSKFVTADEWKAATGERDVPTNPADLSGYNAQEKSMLVQQAWSLAVTARVIDAIEGGDVWGPKAGSRLLEPITKGVRPIKKGVRRPLRNVLGDPLRM